MRDDLNGPRILLEPNEIGTVVVLVVQTTPERGQPLLAIEELLRDSFSRLWRVDHRSAGELLFVSNFKY